jgi:MFS transporter, PPP family, 3-phenylpropionic acid transporter
LAEERRGPHPVARSDRDIRWLFALAGVSTAALLPFFSPLLRSLGLSPDRIGLVLSAMALATVVSAPLWSHEADTRLGTGRTIVWSSIATAACAIALLLAGETAWAIGVAAIMMAAAAAPGTALGDALALGILGPERANDYGRIRRFASLGWAIAVIVFGALYQWVGLWPLLPLYAGTLGIYAWFARRFPASVAAQPGEGRPTRLGALGAVFRASPRLLPFLVGLLLLSVATSATDGFVPLQMLGAGGGPFLIGLAAGLAAVIEIPFFTASSRLAERFGMRNLFLAGVGASIATLFGYAWASSPMGVAVFRSLAGVGFGLKYGALVVLTDRLVAPHLRNTGQALMQTAHWSMGPILGPAIGGFVYVRLGPAALFAGAAVAATCAAAISWWSLRGVGDRDPSAAGTQRIQRGVTRRRGRSVVLPRDGGRSPGS